MQQKSFVAKNVKISDCKNGGLPCCTSVLHKMSDFGVAQNLNFVVALVIAAHKFLLYTKKNFVGPQNFFDDHISVANRRTITILVPPNNY